MEINNCCRCCLMRPMGKYLKMPYTHLGKTEILSDILKECFEIHLTTILRDDEGGICHVCESRLRDARNFKLQVQRSETELRAQLENTLSVKVEEISVKSEFLPDDGLNTEELSVEEVKFEMTLDPLPITGGDQELSLFIGLAEQAKSDVKREPLSRLTSSTEHASRFNPMKIESSHMPATGDLEASLATHSRINPKQETEGTRLQRSENHAETDVYVCDICQKQFPRKISLSRHKRCHKQKQLHECTQCYKQFKFKCHLDMHSFVHTGEKPHACTKCNLTFAHKSYLVKHERERHEQKKYSCDECDKRFALKWKLNSHKRVHTTDKPYSCGECHALFRDPSALNRHIRVHTGEKAFTCDICQKAFLVKNSLISHMGKYHTGRKYFACKLCSNEYGSYQALQEHKQVHSGFKYNCDECKKGFTTRQCFIVHMIKHTGMNPYTCEVCEAVLATKRSLQRHRLTHTGVRAYSCGVCHKRFHFKHNLVDHERIHSGEKPHCCDKCGKRFTKQSSLGTHLKTHIVGVTYQCDLCPKSYSTKEGLRQHKRVHTKIGGSKNVERQAKKRVQKIETKTF